MKRILLLFALILFAGVLTAQRVTNTDVLQVKVTMALKNVVIDSISKDGTISAPSDSKLMTSDAIKEYVDASTGSTNLTPDEAADSTTVESNTGTDATFARDLRFKPVPSTPTLIEKTTGYFDADTTLQFYDPRTLSHIPYRRMLNVLDFGVDHLDAGFDVENINKAINYADTSENKTVYFPDGVYNFDSSGVNGAIIIPEGVNVVCSSGAYFYKLPNALVSGMNWIVMRSNTSWSGGHLASEAIFPNPVEPAVITSNIDVFYVGDDTGIARNVTIENVTIEQGVYGVLLDSTENVTIRNVHFKNCTTSGLLLGSKRLSMYDIWSDRSEVFAVTSFHHLYLGETDGNLSDLHFNRGLGSCIKVNPTNPLSQRQLNISNVVADSCENVFNIEKGINLTINGVVADSCTSIFQLRRWDNASIGNVSVKSNGNTAIIEAHGNGGLLVKGLSINGLNIEGPATFRMGNIEDAQINGGVWLNPLRKVSDLDPIWFPSYGSTTKPNKLTFSDYTFVQDSTHNQNDFIDSPSDSTCFVDFVDCNFYINSGSLSPFARVRPGSLIRFIDCNYSSTQITAFLSDEVGYGGQFTLINTYDRATSKYLSENHGENSILVEIKDSGTGATASDNYFLNVENTNPGVSGYVSSMGFKVTGAVRGFIQGERQGSSTSGYLHLGTNNAGVLTRALSIGPTQFVGIGVADPLYPLHVVGNTITQPNASNLYTIFASRTYNNNDVSAGSRKHGIRVETTYTGTAAYTNGYSGNFIATLTNSSASNVIAGVSGAVEVGGSGSAATLIGGDFFCNDINTITTSIGVRGRGYRTAAGTTTNMRIFESSVLGNSGTITNTYGYYCGDVSQGTQTNTPFSFYAADANANNYFNGSSGFGTNAPDRLLHVEASDAVTNAVTYANRFSHITSATATTGFGTGSEYELENASGTNRVAATEEITYSDAVDATEDATYTLKLIRAGTLTTAVTTLSTGFTGINIAAPISPLHVYEDNSSTDATVGLTIEQDGSGDAMLQYLLTGGQRYTSYIDNSDGDKYKFSSSTNDFLSIDDVNNIALVKILDTGIDRSLSVRSNGIQLIHDDGSNDSALGFGVSGSFVLSTVDATESTVQNQSATGGWGMTVDDAVNFNNVSITADRSQFAGQVAFNSKISPVVTTDQDDWSPTGLGNCNWITVDNGANNVSIGGIVSAKFTNGSRIIIQRLGSGTVTLEHEAAASTAANRFDCAADSNIVISLWLEIIYDSDLDRWLVNN